MWSINGDLRYVKVSLMCIVHVILTHSTHMYTLHDCNKHPHKTQGTFSLGMDIHHIQYVLHYIIIGPLAHITYKYTLYTTTCQQQVKTRRHM